MVKIFYHLWMVNEWEIIFREQMDMLRASGLTQFPIFIGCIGSGESLYRLLDLCTEYDLLAEIGSFGDDEKQYEFPTLEALKEFCRLNPTWKVLYFHGKGASNDSAERQGPWRRVLTEFVTKRPIEMIRRLSSQNTIGLQFPTCGQPFWFYPGNFWWANASYINTLGDFDRSSRYGAEIWIASGGGLSFTDWHDSPVECLVN